MRLLVVALTSWWCLLILGGILVTAGTAYGASSHQVVYRQVGGEIIAHFLDTNTSSLDRTGYLQLEGDAHLYVLHERDFTPALDGQSFGDGDTISFSYRTDSTTWIDQYATNTSTHLQGEAYPIERITVFDQKGKPARQYTTSEYSHHSHGFYQNNWPIGGAVLLGGVLLAGTGLLLLVVQKKKKRV